MKELSIEEKAKRYDEAIEKFDVILNLNTVKESGTISVDDVRKILPELKENEDEKIRKALINIFATHKDYEVFFGVSVKDIIAWLEKQVPACLSHDDEIMIEQLTEYFTTGHGLQNTNETVVAWLNDVKRKLEKQGEQKPIIEMITPEESLGIDSETYNKIVDDCIYGEQKPANKVEPKFHKGEWITNGDYTWKIVEVKPLDYILQSQDGNIVDDTISHVDEQFHSFTIKDVKDGDVLVTREKKQPFIFKKYDEDTDYVYAYCGICDLVKNNSFHADDDQLWTCYSVAGDVYPSTKEQREQLEKAMANAGYIFDFEKKELKKIELKPAWSKEGEKILNLIIARLHSHPNVEAEEYDKDYHWLKSLKERYTWKPSDAQMASITCAVRKMKESACYDSELVSLFNDLKKLREG